MRVALPLSRELTKEEISTISKLGVELESASHGALCFFLLFKDLSYRLCEETTLLTAGSSNSRAAAARAAQL